MDSVASALCKTRLCKASWLVQRVRVPSSPHIDYINSKQWEQNEAGCLRLFSSCRLSPRLIQSQVELTPDLSDLPLLKYSITTGWGGAVEEHLHAWAVRITKSMRLWLHKTYAALAVAMQLWALMNQGSDLVKVQIFWLFVLWLPVLKPC